MPPFLPDARRPHLRDATPCVPGVAWAPAFRVGRACPSPGCPEDWCPRVSCVAWKVEYSGHPGCSEGSVRPGCPEEGCIRRPPFGSVRLSCPGFPHPGFPASRFPRFPFLVRRPSPDSRLPIGGCIVLFRFISMRNPKKTETAESVLRSGLKPVLNRLVYAGFGLPESI